VTYLDPIAAEAFARECERLAAAARALITPRTTSPAKAAARMTRWIKPQPNEPKTRPDR
jgi:hypothetical protein